MTEEKKVANVIVKQEPDLEVPAEILATAITRIAAGLDGWTKAGMRRSALVILLAYSSGIGKRDVVAVLDAINSLQATYCTQKPLSVQKGKQK